MHVTCFTVEYLVLQARRCSTRWHKLAFHPWPGEGLDGAITVPRFQHGFVLGAWGTNPKTAAFCYIVKKSSKNHLSVLWKDISYISGLRLCILLHCGSISSAVVLRCYCLVVKSHWWFNTIKLCKDSCWVFILWSNISSRWRHSSTDRSCLSLEYPAYRLSNSLESIEMEYVLCFAFYITVFMHWGNLIITILSPLLILNNQKPFR